MSRRRVVVVGYGMAGWRLAEAIRRRDPAGERVSLTVLGAEPYPAYNRALLTEVVAGALPPDALWLRDPAWTPADGVDRLLPVAARRIDREGGAVVLADGARIGYDALVLATGAQPWTPPIEGVHAEDGSLTPGVSAFRTLEDCRLITSSVSPGTSVAVVGGGLLGVETALGLAGRGARVTLIHPRPHLMERQLDPPAARVLARSVTDLGVRLRLDTQATAYVLGTGVKLDNGEHVPAELLVICAGTRPRTSLAADAGLAVEHGVLVDDELRTSDPRVRALGDCAQYARAPAGLVQSAWDQADVLADLLTDAASGARYRGTPVVTRLKAAGVELASLGEVHTEPDDPSLETLVFSDAARGRYGKLVLRDERVAGAVLLGLPDAVANIVQLYDRAGPVPASPHTLLLGRLLSQRPAPAGAADLPPQAVVCRCNTVTKARLVEAWRAGARDTGALVAATRAMTGCGGCRDQVATIADWLAGSDGGEEPASRR
ncbi:FAD-dependent oxidoreductase [Streptosporangium sp. CA-135522]|uniref:FAD-dependent oxidoreductase n=1 Tax=Streptosporangium sp. CA-135522 TaxID=3240072 RepID=UPI003D94934F